MELILKDLSVRAKLKNVNYTFKDGITFAYGISGLFLKRLLFGELKKDNGYIYLSSRATITDVSLVSLKDDFNKDNMIDEANYYNDYYELGYKNVLKRCIDSLLMVGLNNEYVNKDFSILSTTELKKIKLAIALFLNSKIIILDNFDKELMDKDKIYFYKLFIKLSKMYHKNIIICSDKLDCYLTIINNIVIFSDNKVVFEGNKKELYNDNIYKYIDIPDVIRFNKYLKENNHVFDNYLEMKELLKAIFRDVENK